MGHSTIFFLQDRSLCTLIHYRLLTWANIISVNFHMIAWSSNINIYGIGIIILFCNTCIITCTGTFWQVPEQRRLFKLLMVGENEINKLLKQANNAAAKEYKVGKQVTMEMLNRVMNIYIVIDKQPHVHITLQYVPSVWWLLLQIRLWCELNYYEGKKSQWTASEPHNKGFTRQLCLAASWTIRHMTHGGECWLVKQFIHCYRFALGYDGLCNDNLFTSPTKIITSQAQREPRLDIIDQGLEKGGVQDLYPLSIYPEANIKVYTVRREYLAVFQIWQFGKELIWWFPTLKYL